MKKFLLIISLAIFSYGSWNSFLNNLNSNNSISKNNSTITSNEKILAIKKALQDSANYAISNLSKQNGFLYNKHVSIPIPNSLQKVANIIKKYGGKQYVDNFKASINHAAEKAMPSTMEIFQNSIKNMSIKDATRLLKGKNGSITKYFKEKNSKLLYQKIYPIVKNSMKNKNVMHYYDSFKEYYKKYAPKTSLEKNNNFLMNLGMNILKQTRAKKYIINLSEKNLDNYITKKSIDGIFYMMAQEETKIRKNPLAYTTGIVKKIFAKYVQ